MSKFSVKLRVTRSWLFSYITQDYIALLGVVDFKRWISECRDPLLNIALSKAIRSVTLHTRDDIALQGVVWL